MTRSELRQQIDKATNLVNTWPGWKRNILAHSSQPSVSAPRPPVNNETGQSQSQSEKGSERA